MVEDFCFELNKYLQRQFNYKRPPARVGMQDNITAKRVKFDLYLRYRKCDQDNLVIARIYFEEERKGHGTRLLKFICQHAAVHNFKYIVIETPNENSLAFGRKFGFTPVLNGYLSISIEDLIRNLGQRK